MQIDNNACIGCNACVVACTSENNISTVGKEQVLNNREMHWLRIDTYFDGDPAGQVNAHFEPVMCMHCETAPCEIVCPVNATSHSAEGLNEMTYNRCVGTRYCSNNCPYKVRRFNYLQFAKQDEPIDLLGKNPEVTIRMRGIMEKCTYCVQRINRTRIDFKGLEVQLTEATDPQAKAAVRKRMDLLMSTLETACQQACPTEAITFGDLNYQFLGEDGKLKPSPVKQLVDQPLSFGLLADELNTRPRTNYLPRLTNPNETLAGTAAKKH
jgi:Fe-S-cluster-containing dehydrogenase component